MLKRPIIIGIDPGYDRLGWAVGQEQAGQWQIMGQGCIQTNSKDDLTQRYQQLIDELTEILERFKPQEAAIEQLFWSHNQTTAMAVSESRGLILTLFLQHGLLISQYTPSQIKQAVTGYGRADKKAVEKMVRLQLAISHKQAKAINDDTFDALALLICHQAARKLNQL